MGPTMYLYIYFCFLIYKIFLRTITSYDNNQRLGLNFSTRTRDRGFLFSIY